MLRPSKILWIQEDELKGAVLVVLANKQDMEGALSVAEVHQALGLDALKNRTFQIFKTSATKGEGLDQAMDWLSNALTNHKWHSFLHLHRLITVSSSVQLLLNKLIHLCLCTEICASFVAETCVCFNKLLD